MNGIEKIRQSVVCGLQSVSRRARTPGLQSDSRAFTLIELLVAMAILLVIVLMLSNLFQQSTRAWETGIRQTEMGLEARAAVNMIQRELSQAIYTNGSFHVINDAGELEPIDPVASSGFAFVIQPVPGYEDLYEVRLEQTSQSRIAGVRVYADGRAHGSGMDDVETVDTSSGF